MARHHASIAATSTLAMVRTATARGFETADVLEEAGLTRDSLEDPDARIAAPTVLAIWNALRERTGDPTLQLVAPSSLPFGAYRVLDYLILASATVGEGVRRFARFFGLIADAVTLDIQEGDGDHCLCLTMRGGGPVPPVYVDYVFAALIGRIRTWGRADLAVCGIDLHRPEPPAAARYSEFFRAPVRFGAAADRLCLCDAEWDAPIEGADAALAELLEAHARILAQRIPHAASGFTAEVERTLTEALPEGRSASQVARALHVSVRTLQRKLVEEGTTFREEVDSVSARLAVDYLVDPKVSIAEVAFLLGFSEPSSFNRAFRRWTGESPGQWRRRRADVSRT
ncbi:MAG: AraC family transcriptional regulator [Longimicrobiales bacterium]